MRKLQAVMFRAVSKLPLVAAILVPSVSANVSRADSIAFNQTGQIGNQTGGPYDLGSYFTVNTPIQVTGLGAFDPTGTGLAANVFVSIYQVDNSPLAVHAPLISESLTSANTHAVVGSEYDFLNGGVSTFLQPGTYMVVGSNFGASAEVDNNSCCGGGAYPITNTGNGALSFPVFGTDDAGQYGNYTGMPGYPSTADTNTYLAATFTFVNSPEPSSLVAFCGLGLAGLIVVAKRRRSIASARQS